MANTIGNGINAGTPVIEVRGLKILPEDSIKITSDCGRPVKPITMSKVLYLDIVKTFHAVLRKTSTDLEQARKQVEINVEASFDKTPSVAERVKMDVDLYLAAAPNVSPEEIKEVRERAKRSHTAGMREMYNEEVQKRMGKILLEKLKSNLSGTEIPDTPGKKFLAKIFTTGNAEYLQEWADGMCRSRGLDGRTRVQRDASYWVQDWLRILHDEILTRADSLEVNIEGLARKKSKVRQAKGTIKEARATFVPNGGGEATGAKKAGAGRKMRRAAGNVTVPKTEVPRAAETKAADAKVPEVRVRRVPKAKI